MKRFNRCTLENSSHLFSAHWVALLHLSLFLSLSLSLSLSLPLSLSLSVSLSLSLFLSLSLSLTHTHTHFLSLSLSLSYIFSTTVAHYDEDSRTITNPAGYVHVLVQYYHYVSAHPPPLFFVGIGQGSLWRKGGQWTSGNGDDGSRMPNFDSTETDT